MTNIGNFLAIGLGFNSLTELGLPGADVVGNVPQNGCGGCLRDMRKTSGIPLRSTCIGTCGRTTTERAGDCSANDFGGGAAGFGRYESDEVPAGYVELFRV